MGAYTDAPLSEIRRDLHEHPEQGWMEYRTSALVADTLADLDYTTYPGSEALDVDARMGVPSQPEHTDARERAKECDISGSYLNEFKSTTGVVAEREFGNGPTVGLRVDMDALPVTESDAATHKPAKKGFRSQHPGTMHACGHDGHVAIGIGVARKIASNGSFDGTLKLFFQPAEEGLRGGHAMSQTDHLDDVDYFFSLHLGLSYPTGTIVAGLERPYPSRKVSVQFTGESAHAGLAPQEGRNAVQALSTAITNLYGILRHSEGLTRINVGNVQAPNGQNVIAQEARMRYEVRSDIDEVCQYLTERATQTIEHAAGMHDVAVEESVYGSAPTFEVDEEAVELVANAAGQVGEVADVIRRDQLEASEDVAHLVRQVQDHGGQATYLGIGASNSAGHHQPQFDIDEQALDIGVSVITQAIRGII